MSLAGRACRLGWDIGQWNWRAMVNGPSGIRDAFASRNLTHHTINVMFIVL